MGEKKKKKKKKKKSDEKPVRVALRCHAAIQHVDH